MFVFCWILVLHSRHHLLLCPCSSIKNGNRNIQLFRLSQLIKKLCPLQIFTLCWANFLTKTKHWMHIKKTRKKNKYSRVINLFSLTPHFYLELLLFLFSFHFTLFHIINEQYENDIKNSFSLIFFSSMAQHINLRWNFQAVESDETLLKVYISSMEPCHSFQRLERIRMATFYDKHCLNMPQGAVEFQRSFQLPIVQSSWTKMETVSSALVICQFTEK